MRLLIITVIIGWLGVGAFAYWLYTEKNITRTIWNTTADLFQEEIADAMSDELVTDIEAATLGEQIGEIERIYLLEAAAYIPEYSLILASYYIEEGEESEEDATVDSLEEWLRYYESDYSALRVAKSSLLLLAMQKMTEDGHITGEEYHIWKDYLVSEHARGEEHDALISHFALFQD